MPGFHRPVQMQPKLLTSLTQPADEWQKNVRAPWPQVPMSRMQVFLQASKKVSVLLVFGMSLTDPIVILIFALPARTWAMCVF